VKDLALVDADIVCFRCAASSEHDPQDIAEIRVNEMMQKILHDTNAKTYKAFLTGKNNFRYDIYPEYKANRKGKPRPIHLQACRDLLVTQWNAEITDGYEADDALGIEQTKANLDSVICSIDKEFRKSL
jgi:5'-3' exonuclease